MKNSTDEKLKQLLVDLAEFDKEKYEIVNELRNIVFKLDDTISERMMYGGFMFSLGKDFGGIFISKNHVSFEFSNGYLLKNEFNHLEGSGKKRRHLKIHTVVEIEKKEAERYIKQAIKLCHGMIE